MSSTERLFVNPADLAVLRRMKELQSGPGLSGDTFMGVPVVSSPVVPVGQIVRANLPEPAFAPPPKWDPPFSAYARFHYGFEILKPFRNLAITLCEAGPFKRETAAQRRRRTKRFIREEIARRRLIKFLSRTE